MNDLSPRAQRVLHLARGADEPDELTQARVERGLATRIALGAGAAGAATGLAASASGSTAPLAVKALVALGVSAGLGGAWVVGENLQLGRAPSAIASGAQLHPPTRANPPTTGTVPLGATAPVKPPEPVARLTPVPLPAAAPVEAARASGRATPAPSVERSSLERSSTAAFPVTSSEPARVERETPTRPDAASEPDPLRAETAALRAAQVALRAGDARHALALLDEQDDRFRAGSLQEERAAARVLALCQAYGPEGVRGAAERFEQRFPQSALLARVRSACRDRSTPATQDSIRRK